MKTKVNEVHKRLVEQQEWNLTHYQKEIDNLIKINNDLNPESEIQLEMISKNTVDIEYKKRRLEDANYLIKLLKSCCYEEM